MQARCKNSLLDMSSDLMIPKSNTSRPFNTQLNWENDDESIHNRTVNLVWYTNRSKTDIGAEAEIPAIAYFCKRTCGEVIEARAYMSSLMSRRQ